jgi:hypothetical protein
VVVLAELIRRLCFQHLSGGGHPKVIRVERVQDSGGADLAVALVRGNFTLPMSCGLGPGPCRPQHAHYFTLAFSPRHPDSWSSGLTTVAELAAVAEARKARPLFGIFPDFAYFSIRCAIPRGGSHPGTIAGLCHTSYEPLDHGRVAVAFGEKWPLASNGYTPQQTSARWVVTLNRAVTSNRSASSAAGRLNSGTERRPSAVAALPGEPVAAWPLLKTSAFAGFFGSTSCSTYETGPPPLSVKERARMTL